MRFLFLATQDQDGSSMTGRWLPMARRLIERGHQVEILTLHPEYSSLQTRSVRHNGLRLRYVAPMHVRRAGSVRAYYPTWQLPFVAARAALALWAAALRAPTDVIWVLKPQPMNGLAGWLASRLRRLPLWVDCDDDEAASNRFSSLRQRRAVAAVERWLPRAAARVTTNTRHLYHRLEAWGVPGSRISFLPNGVEPERFPPPDTARLAALRAALGLEGRPVVSFIGSLSLANHAVDLLVQAFARLAGELPHARLLLVGGGEDLPAVQRLVDSLGLRERTVFTGRVPPHEVAAYYAISTVTVDPVHADDAARGRAPLKIPESWWCGVPLVTGDVGDRRLTFGEPPAGVLAAPGDAAALAEGLRQVLCDTSLAQALAARGRERVRAYTWTRLIDAFMDEVGL